MNDSKERLSEPQVSIIRTLQSDETGWICVPRHESCWFSTRAMVQGKPSRATINALVERGYLKRIDDPGRIKRYILTERGRAYDGK